MQVLAPKDGYITAVAVKEGDTVAAGAVIVQMDTTQEDLNLARIAAIDSLRSIFAKRLTSPAVDLTRRLTQIAVDIAKIQEHASTTVSTQADSLAGLGMGAAIPQLDQRLIPFDRKASKDVTPLQRETAEKNLAMFEYVIAEAGSVNQLVAAHIQQKEAPAAQALRNSLTLKALNVGTVSLSVTTGSYVLKGSQVFEVK